MTSAVLLTLGWLAIKGRGPWAASGRREGTHKALMLSAFGVSTVFLASYLEYHARVGSIAFAEPPPRTKRSSVNHIAATISPLLTFAGGAPLRRPPRSSR